MAWLNSSGAKASRPTTPLDTFEKMQKYLAGEDHLGDIRRAHCLKLLFLFPRSTRSSLSCLQRFPAKENAITMRERGLCKLGLNPVGGM